MLSARLASGPMRIAAGLRLLAHLEEHGRFHEGYEAHDRSQHHGSARNCGGQNVLPVSAIGPLGADANRAPRSPASKMGAESGWFANCSYAGCHLGRVFPMIPSQWPLTALDITEHITASLPDMA